MRMRQEALHGETQKPVYAVLPGTKRVRYAQPVERQRAGGRKRLERDSNGRTIPEGGG